MFLYLTFTYSHAFWKSITLNIISQCLRSNKMHKTKSTISPFFPKFELFLFIVSFHNFYATDLYRDNHTKPDV